MAGATAGGVSAPDGAIRMSEAAWRRRFRAARTTLPGWARDDQERLIYASNTGGKWEVYAWDRRRETHRQVTDRPAGTLRGQLDPDGRRICWFDDDRAGVQCRAGDRAVFCGARHIDRGGKRDPPGASRRTPGTALRPPRERVGERALARRGPPLHQPLRARRQPASGAAHRRS